jgi:hypothetical protein
VAQLHPIERLFGRYASTDIRSSDDVLKLLELLVQSAGHPVRQIPFNANLGPSYVTASAGRIRSTVDQFLNGGGASARLSTGGGPSAPKKMTSQGPVALSPASASEIAQQRGLAATVPFKVYYPARRVTTGSAPPDETRYYQLNGHPAYVVVVAQGGLGQYYDLEGTTWSDPPILHGPNQTVRAGGRTMRLYYSGQRLRVVAWHDGRGVYWLANTLSDALSNRQMLAIASAAKRS